MAAVGLGLVVSKLALEYSVSTSMHLIGPLQVPKCNSNLIQVSIIYRNLQVYT